MGRRKPEDLAAADKPVEREPQRFRPTLAPSG
jgi:hypothetical protein